jgi:hypothetical protein
MGGVKICLEILLYINVIGGSAASIQSRSPTFRRPFLVPSSEQDVMNNDIDPL